MKGLKFIFLIYLAAFLIYIYLYTRIKNQKMEIQYKASLLKTSRRTITPSEFVELRNKRFGGRGGKMYLNNFNFMGVYIVRNENKRKYYIGHGQHVFNRVDDLISGRGNQYVYKDIRNGDQINISFLALDSSNFESLQELEKRARKNMNDKYTNYADSKSITLPDSSVPPSIPSQSPRTTVTRRLINFEQPYGGYITNKQFVMSDFEDNIVLREKKLTGIKLEVVVDYLTRLLLGETKEKTFEISLKGAKNVNQEEYSLSLLSNIKDLSDQSIISTAKLVSFNSYCRTAKMNDEKYYDRINPDALIIKNIRVLVQRTQKIFEEYGPITSSSLTIYDDQSLYISNGGGILEAKIQYGI